MKNNQYYIMAVFILFIVFGCKGNKMESEINFFTPSLDSITIDNNVKWIVILPGLGCPGCIEEGEAFIREFVENKQILFILTKIESLKILQNKIEIEIEDYSNIIIDKKGVFDLPTDNGIYPCIINLSKGDIIDLEFQSPKNSMAFENLKTKIITLQKDR